MVRSLSHYAKKFDSTAQVVKALAAANGLPITRFNSKTLVIDESHEPKLRLILDDARRNLVSWGFEPRSI